MDYEGIFETVVDKGNPESSSGKFIFELQGESTLPTLLISKPSQLTDDRYPLLKFKKTKLNKKSTETIVLRNERVVSASVKFKPIKHDNLEFKRLVTTTLKPKEHYSFDIAFISTKVGQISYQLDFETLNNLFECHKVVIQDEGYQEYVTFENLPEELKDELRFGNAIVNKSKEAEFSIINTSDKPVRFE